MTLLRHAFVLAVLPAFLASAGLVGLTRPASAQGFFERLFGIQPPPQEPIRRPPPPPGSGPGPGGGPEAPSAPVVREPPPARPVALKAPSESSVVGRELKLDGNKGSMLIERSGSDYNVRLTLQGINTANPTETCTAPLNGGAPVPLTSEGQPEGAPRYEIRDPACPLRLNVLDGAVLANAIPDAACTLATAECRAEATGMWGPDPASLTPKAREYEQARGSADKAVRDNYKVLTQRAGPGEVRPIVTEQAAFSSEREQVCRSYARESAHSFCNARFTEWRGLALASRLGLRNQASAEPREPRARRSRAAPVPPPPGVQIPGDDPDMPE